MHIDVLRLVERIHGHVAWLTTAALVHPAWLLRHRARRAHAAVGMTVVLVTATFGSGAWLYEPYRATVKLRLFTEAPALGFAFERKEHLAFGALCLTWAGAAAYVAAEHTNTQARLSLRTTAHRAFCAAAAFAFIAATLGTMVAAYASF